MAPSGLKQTPQQSSPKTRETHIHTSTVTPALSAVDPMQTAALLAQRPWLGELPMWLSAKPSHLWLPPRTKRTDISLSSTALGRPTHHLYIAGRVSSPFLKYVYRQKLHTVIDSTSLKLHLIGSTVLAFALPQQHTTARWFLDTTVVETLPHPTLRSARKISSLHIRHLTSRGSP